MIVHMRFQVLLSVLLLAFVALSAGAEEAAPARKPRPPPEYSGRVQLHELPATVAPPKLPDVKEDARRVEPRSAPGLFADRPAPAPMMPIEMPGPESGLPSLRELINESSKRSDSLSGSTGWGWLADDIATNRARRAEREARQRADDLQDENREDEFNTNERQDSFSLSSAFQPDRPEAGPVRAASRADSERPTDSAWISAAQPTDEVALEGRIDREIAPRERFFARAPPEPASGFLAGGPEFDRRAEADRRLPVDRDAVDRAAPVRPVFEGTRLLKNEDFWPVDRPGGSGARVGFEPLGGSMNLSPIWTAPAFTPLAIGPSELSTTLAPSAPSSIGTMNAAPASPALGGMGSERERAAPRTLPW